MTFFVTLWIVTYLLIFCQNWEQETPDFCSLKEWVLKLPFVKHNVPSLFNSEDIRKLFSSLRWRTDWTDWMTWSTSWGTTLWAPRPLCPLTSTACWTRPTMATWELPALYRSPVTLQPWLTTITLLVFKSCSMLCVCVYAGIQFQEFSTRCVCMFSSCKGCCPWNRKLSTMGECCDASPLYGERTVCADSNSTVGDAFIVHSHSSLFPFQQTRGFWPSWTGSICRGKGFLV